MKMNVPLTLKQLKVAELTQLITSSLDTLAQKEIQSSDTMVTALLDRLRANLPQLRASLKQERGSALTQNLTEALYLRNADLTVLSNAIKIHKVSRTTEKQEAFKELSSLLKHYKDIKKSSLEESFALVNSLLEKLKSPQYAKLATLLNLKEAIANLKESQDKLYQLYLQRSQESSTKTVIDTAKVRKDIEQDYKLLYQHLQNKLAFDQNDECKVMVQLFNDIRQDYTEQVKRRRVKTDKTNASPDETNSETA